MSDWQDDWENAFKKADAQQYEAVAKALAGYRRALMAEGFTRNETRRLVEAYSTFLYDMTLSAIERDEEDSDWEEADDVDPEEET